MRFFHQIRYTTASTAPRGAATSNKKMKETTSNSMGFVKNANIRDSRASFRLFRLLPFGGNFAI
jgi:hypothetical protein